MSGMEYDEDKVCQLNILLWDTEKEVIELNKKLQEKDDTIKELHSEIYFSDLELKEMRQLVEKSCEVTFLTNILTKVQQLSRTVKDMEAKVKEAEDVMKKAEDVQYLQMLNDRNDKLMSVNKHLMEQLYKGKVIYM